MILFLYRKLIYSLSMIFISFFFVFFIFSVLNNLSNYQSFKNIVIISLTDSFQIINYVPSLIFLVSVIFLSISLRATSELVIIKFYFSKYLLVLGMVPFFLFFSFLDINKSKISDDLNRIVNSILEINKNDEFKVIIENSIEKRIFNVFKGIDYENNKLSEFLRYEIDKNKINKSIYSNELGINNQKITLNNYILYGKDTFIEKEDFLKLDYKFLDLINNNLIIYRNYEKELTLSEIVILVNKYISSFIFYLVIFFLFFNKNISKKSNLKIPLLFVSIFFFYNLSLSNIHLINHQTFFSTSISIIFLLIFLKLFINE